MTDSHADRPNLEYHRKQAKRLLAAMRDSDADARARWRQHHPAPEREPALHGALHVIAREQGHPSWPRFKQHVETQALPRAERAARLVRAACSNDVRLARVLLDNDPSLARHDLFTACACGEVRAVEEMLAHDPAAARRKGGPDDREPILYACHSRLLRADAARAAGIVEVVRRLLDAGADPNAHALLDWEGEKFTQTPLYGAAGIANHAELTRMLLEAGADANEMAGEPDPANHLVAQWGPEALYHCTEFADTACLRLLLAARPHPLRVSYCLGRALDYADCHERVVLYLEHGADPDFRVPWFRNQTHLAKAVQNGRPTETVRAMIDAGGDVNAEDADRRTPLRWAVRGGHEALAALLRERGADESRVTEADRAWAAARRGERLPEALRDDAAAGELLCAAVERGDLAALRAMLDAGVSIDARPVNPHAFTPLHHACWRGLGDAARLLVERGADIHWVNGYGGAALGTTIHGSANCFDRHGGPGMKLAEEAVDGDYVAILELLIARGGRLPDRITGGSLAVQEVLRRHGVPDAED